MIYTYFKPHFLKLNNVPTKSKLQHPPPPPNPTSKPQAFDLFLCTGRGEFDLCLGVMRKIEPEASGFDIFLFMGAEVTNSYKHVLGQDGIN